MYTRLGLLQKSKENNLLHTLSTKICNIFRSLKHGKIFLVKNIVKEHKGEAGVAISEPNKMWLRNTGLIII